MQTNEIRFEKMPVRIGNPGKESTLPPLLGNSALQSHIEFELDETDEIFEGYGRLAVGYPYREFTTYDRTLSDGEVETAVLDNGHIRAVFLPEYGGRLWSLYDYDHKKELLYTNDVLRYSNLAVRNAWFSGGVEWNAGVIGHSPLTTEKMHTAVLKNDEGQAVLRMYQYARIRGVEYQMDFWIDHTGDVHYLNCRMRVVNSSSETVAMYWWSNMAVPEYPQGRIAVPAAEAFTCRYMENKGIVYKVPFPGKDGDISYYESIPDQVDYFFNIEKAAPKYIANLDKDGCGLLHVSTDRLKGRKLFSWGHNDGSDSWQEFLTENAGKYVEIQAGLAKTQYGCIPFAAHTAWEWLEQYSYISVREDVKELPFEEFQKQVMADVRKVLDDRKTEQLLIATQQMAKTKADVMYFGKAYGSLANHIRALTGERSLSQHLAYPPLTNELKAWADFMESGRFMQHLDIGAAPEEFQCDEAIYRKLIEVIENDENRENWYAHYHLGIMYMQHQEFAGAQQEFIKAETFCDEVNPWTAHGLAVLSWKMGEKTEAEVHICRGTDVKSDDLSYVKECFRLLMQMTSYMTVVDLYRKLPGTIQKEHRVYYDYLVAAVQTGEEAPHTVLQILENNFVVDDVREGEDSIGEFYRSLYADIYGKDPEKLPHHLNYNSLA